MQLLHLQWEPLIFFGMGVMIAVELIVMMGDVLECGKLGCVGCGCANSKLSEGEVCWLSVVNNFLSQL